MREWLYRKLFGELPGLKRLELLENALVAQAKAIGDLRKKQPTPLHLPDPPSEVLARVFKRMDEIIEIHSEMKKHDGMLSEALIRTSIVFTTYKDVQRVSSDLQKQKVQVLSLSERVGELELQRTQNDNL